MDPHYNHSAPPQERHFDLTVERKMVAPDGVPRLMYTINGQFPGPTIEATEGDTIVVRVRNHIFDDYVVPEPPITSRLYDVFSEGTDRKVALHWHGLSMRGQQVMDGAASFTSCPILPGNETVYRFTVLPEDVGTHWYHSHVSTLRTDGLWGMLIVHARKDERSLFQERAPNARIHWDEEIAVALGDHFHVMSPESLAEYVSLLLSNAEPVPDNGLINGKHIFSCATSRKEDVPCPAGDVDMAGEYATFHLNPQRTYRLRLANVGALADVTFSVDGHTMTVIEADGTLVEPMTVHRIPIAPGQRYSVILHREPSSKRDRVWMRSEMSGECFKYMNPVMDPMVKAIVDYDDDDLHWMSPLRLRSYRRASERLWSKRWGWTVWPTSQPWGDNVTDAGIPEEPCHDLEPGVLAPLIPDPPPALDFSRGDRREIINIEVLNRHKYMKAPMAFLNMSTWRPYGHRGSSVQPLLYRISHSNVSTPEEWERMGLVNREHELVVTTHPNQPTVFELVLYNYDDGPHPFHLHGHKFWVLHTGEMERLAFQYTKEVEASWDLSRVIKRDTAVVPMLGHAVIRWVADNPGVWAFHCHMDVHLASGMAMAFAEQPEVLQAHPPVPATCS
ncbi:L-ascorbate oxidase [Malassezia nana]|uniref:laccase n=1 Tax=Malassezia nana TaxID=180528 RepID=A0AAF0EQ63_9BASI|nr:L-ascorbate oxidase [Malassezia nana]